MYYLTKAELKTLVRNQNICKDLPPITTRATFKLSALKDLIKQIESMPGYDDTNDMVHRLCITFVREEISSSILGYSGCINFGEMKKRAASKKNKLFTQLVPIITGCKAELDNNTARCKRFRYLKVKGKIPYVRSGGEGSGLIPPPPPVGADD